MNPYSGGSTLATVRFPDLPTFTLVLRQCLGLTSQAALQVLRVSAAGFGLIYGTSKLASLRVRKARAPPTVFNCLTIMIVSSQICDDENLHLQLCFIFEARFLLALRLGMLPIAGKGGISIQGKCSCCSICSALMPAGIRSQQASLGLLLAASRFSHRTASLRHLQQHSPGCKGLPGEAGLLCITDQLQSDWRVQLRSGDRQHCSLSPAKVAISNSHGMRMRLAGSFLC